MMGRFRFLFDVLKKFDGDHGFFLSAGITFNHLICVVPFILLLLAGIFLLMSMVLTSFVTFLQSYRFQPSIDIGPFLQWILKYLVPFFSTFWMCFLVYKIIPNKKIRFKIALRAASFTSLLWEVAKQLFGWYVFHLGRFSMVYGSLSTLAIFFLWIYYSSAILILGGEVAFLLEEKGLGQTRS
jgi:membrane protein